MQVDLCDPQQKHGPVQGGERNFAKSCRQKPEFIKMLNNLAPSDKVLLTFYKVVAVSVHPASNRVIDMRV
jgi:hypothetical protein